MTMTRTAFISEVLKKLSVLGSGMTANAEDYAAIDVLIDPALEELRLSGVIYISDTANFPDKLVMPLILYFASECASLFGASSVDGMTIPEARKSAMMRLAKVDNLAYVGDVQKAVYY